MNYEVIFEVIQPGNTIFIHIFSLLLLCVQVGWKSLVLMCNPLSFSYDIAVIVFLPLLHA